MSAVKIRRICPKTPIMRRVLTNVLVPFTKKSEELPLRMSHIMALPLRIDTQLAGELSFGTPLHTASLGEH